MEQVRMPPAQPQAASKAPATTGGEDKPEASDAGTERKAGFALLLAALDGAGAAATLAPEAVAGVAGQPALAPAAAGDAAADDGLTATGASPPGRAQAPQASLGPRACAPVDDDGQPAHGAAVLDADAHVSLQEHLSMLLNQGLHTQAGQALQLDSMVNETARIDAAVPPSTALGARRGAGLMAGARSAVQAPGLPLQAAAVGAPVVGGGDAALFGATDAGTGDAASAAATSGQLLKSMLEKAPGADARVSLQPQGGGAAWAPAAQTAASASPLMADVAAARPSRSDAAGGGPAQGGPGGHAGLPPAPLQPGGGASDLAGGAGGEGGPPGSFMEQLGEQVAFWVHQKSQRAEFTLDRDGQPVQVQLSLTGDVARVTFLTDHDAARQALDAGVQELRERLQQQGLELADVNVDVARDQGGGALHQGRGDAARRERGATGSARVQASEPIVGPSRPTATHRALDVFV